MHHHLFESIIQLVSLAVSVAGLIYLIIYVKATKGIERASNEQSEGLSKPYMAVCSGVRTPPHPTLESGIKAALSQGFGIVSKAEVLGEFVEILNLGNGPAIELSWHIGRRQQLSQIYQRSQGDYEGFVPYVRPKQKTPLPMSSGLLDSSPFTVVGISYRGLSGKKYVQTTWLERRKVVRPASEADPKQAGRL